MLVDAFLGEERLAGIMEAHELHAPVTVDAEVLHGLRRAWLARRIDEVDATFALNALRNARLHRHPIEPLIPRIWSLRHNFTAYDAAYVALAESLGLPLLTRDRRLARASGHDARIEYID